MLQAWDSQPWGSLKAEDPNPGHRVLYILLFSWFNTNPTNQIINSGCVGAGKTLNYTPGVLQEQGWEIKTTKPTSVCLWAFNGTY